MHHWRSRSASGAWLPSVVVFELRYGVSIHPEASRRRKLELALKRLIAELIQERIAPAFSASRR